MLDIAPEVIYLLPQAETVSLDMKKHAHGHAAT
jgi:hypothetical protein